MMKSKLLALMAGAMMGMAHTANRQRNPDTGIDDPREREWKKRLADKAEIERMERQGMQQFTIDGKTVWARNYKNALRKANNLS